MSYKIIKYGDPLKGSQDTLDQTNIKLGALIAAQTKVLAPVALKFGGTLRNSYMYRTNTSDGMEEGGFNDSPGTKATEKLSVQPEKNSGYVGSNVDYAGYQEFGTKKMVAQPHLRPAVDIVIGRDAKKVMQDIADEQMAQAIKLGKKIVKSGGK